MYHQVYLGKAKLFWFPTSTNFYLRRRRNGLGWRHQGLNLVGYAKIEFVGWVRMFLGKRNAFFVIIWKWLCFITPLKTQRRLLLNQAYGYKQWLFIVLFGFYKTFRARFYLSGINKRIERLEGHVVDMSLHSNHVFRVIAGDRIRFKKPRIRGGFKVKHSFSIRSWDYFALVRAAFIIQRLSYPDSYNALGIRVWNDPVILKPRKRWGQL